MSGDALRHIVTATDALELARDQLRLAAAALSGKPEVAPALAPRPPPTALHWATTERIEFLQRWYPSYVPGALVFRALRALQGPAPPSDGSIVTYTTQSLKVRRPADLRINLDAVGRACLAFRLATGIEAPPPVVVQRPEPVRWLTPAPVAPAVVPQAPGPAGPGAAIWHHWAQIKELARRDNVILDSMDQLPAYNKRREARGMPPLYLKKIERHGGTPPEDS